MISTDPVLGAAVPVYDELTDAYGRVKKLLPAASAQVAPAPSRAEDRSAVQYTLNTGVEGAIRHMREAMRLDLGVSDESGSADDQRHPGHTRHDLDFPG